MVGNLYLRLLLTCLISPLIIGCSTHTPALVPLVSSEFDESHPLAVSILEEHYDGKQLSVAADISAFRTVLASDVVLQLKALREGEKIGESFYSLAAAPEGEDGEIDNGEKVRVIISVTASDLTDYQLNLLWGHDAKSYLSNLPLEARLVVKDVKLAREPKLSIVGSIENKSSEIIRALSLGVGFVWVPLGGSSEDQAPGEETISEVPDFELAPGRSKVFSIEITQDIPIRDDGRFEPIVRVIER